MLNSDASEGSSDIAQDAEPDKVDAVVEQTRQCEIGKDLRKGELALKPRRGIQLRYI